MAYIYQVRNDASIFIGVREHRDRRTDKLKSYAHVKCTKMCLKDCNVLNCILLLVYVEYSGIMLSEMGSSHSKVGCCTVRKF